MIISKIISTLVYCLIGWILIEKVPYWLNIKGFLATIVKIIGVLIIIYSLTTWISI